MKILGIIKNGKLALSEFTRAKWNDFLKDPAHEGRTIAIQDRIPESLNQRGFYQGGVLRLWAYLNGLDFRDGDIIQWLHNEAKKEFNGEDVLLDGKPTRRGMSTKGLLSENDLQNSGYLERVIQNLEDNYGIDRNKVLNTEHYLDWRDRVQVEFPEKYETYIDYLISLNFLEAGLRK